MDWLRLDSDFPRHPKVLRLALTLGISVPAAVGHLTCLFCAVAEHAESGDLTEIGDEELELWAGWSGANGKIDGRFATAIIDIGFVDATTRELHGWAKRHEAMFSARTRSRRARLRTKSCDGSRTGSQVSAPQGATKSLTLQLRSPDGASDVHHLERDGSDPRAGIKPTLPDRTLPDKKGDSPPSTPPPPVAAKAYAPEVVRLHSVFREATGRPTHELTPKAAAKLAELIGWAGSVEVAERGVRKVGRSDHHRGHNAQGLRYDKLSDRPFATADTFRGWCEEPLPLLAGVRGGGTGPPRRETPGEQLERVRAEAKAKADAEAATRSAPDDEDRIGFAMALEEEEPSP